MARSCFKDQEALLLFKLFAAIGLYPVNYMVANWSAGHTIEFKNIGKNVVVASKSESRPTALVATVLPIDNYRQTYSISITSF